MDRKMSASNGSHQTERRVMKRKLDLTSALLGLLTGASVVLLIGAAAPPNTNCGRYQAVLYDGLALVIDTSTGQVWRHTTVTSLNNHKDFFEPKLGKSAE